MGKGLTIHLWHIFIIRTEISQPWALLTCGALIIFSISLLLNWKEESSTVGVFHKKWGNVHPLLCGVPFDA